VVIRPNRYQAGRAHIIVYNWTGRDSMAVDVSAILSPGMEFEIRKAEDYFGIPVLAGTYDGKPLRLPMTELSVAQPIGYDFTASSTAPKFGVFVLIAR
jgi:hypothetical protein